ncbi:flagellar biosynthetic protein FliR [Oscillospiraceae bacterium OttesenSCG-928-G22]|nr:flagellar biosynthetic protein FliR [Oscillospiraceae bacterium OttesenSCG-928-G22]
MSDALVTWISYFALIFCRMAALFTLSPVLGRRNLPNQARILLSALLALIVVNLRPMPDGFMVNSLFGYLLLVVNEILVGLVIGYITTVFFSLTFVAGQVIDMQTGFGMVQVFDVQANVQVPIYGSILNMMMLLAFVISDGHVALVSLMFSTYDYLPVGGGVLTGEVVEVLLKSFFTAFSMAINVAIPVIAAILLAEVGMGIIVRTAPQMNVFVVGVPIKIIIGFLIIYMIVPTFMNFTGVIFEEMFTAIDAALAGFAVA